MIELKGKYCKDCKVFIDDVEESAMSTIYNILDAKAFEGCKVRIMPDVHDGLGIVVGFSSNFNDMVNPSHIGCDIGCGIETIVFDKSLNKEDYPIFEHRVKKEIPTGFDINERRVFDMKDFIKFIKSEFSRVYSINPNMISDDVDISENGISKMLKRIGMDEGMFYKSIGSLGGGNHFEEYGETSDGSIAAFTVHCGSRNFGMKVFRYWENMANNPSIDKKALKEAIAKLKSETKDKRELPSKIEELKKSFEPKIPNGYLSGDNLIGYLTDMVFAQAYAKYNRKVILDKVISIMYKINQAKVIDHIASVHNYIDFEDGIIRKGAIRSYIGEKMVVPFNMRDGIAICEGKSNEDWNCTCSHGSGRKMSRSVAKKTLSMDEFKDTMKDVYSTSVCIGTLDESPMAYKDTDVILSHIQDTCQVLYMLIPKINIKAADADVD